MKFRTGAWSKLLFGLLIGLGGCESGTATPEQLPPKVAQANIASNSPALRLAYIQTRQQEDRELYRGELVREGVRFVHGEQAWGAQLDERGLALQSQGGDFDLTMQLQHLPCGDAAGVPVRLRNSRAEYDRDGITEWYMNGPLGLEQGFKLASRPDCAEKVQFKLKLGGNLTASQDGAAIGFHDQQGSLILHYSDLYAQDADGQQLPARMVLLEDGKQIQIEVDDTRARYPIEIDPLIYTVEQAKLLAADRSSDDLFGEAVALSNDGSTALVGASWRSESGVYSGAAYVFIRSGNFWTQQAKLRASDIAAYDHFGRAVALSADGNTALLGAPAKSNAGTPSVGAAYVFSRSGAAWLQQSKLLASVRSSGAEFGTSVSLSSDGTLALIGAPNDSDGAGRNSGTAYIFSRSTGWVQQAKLLSADRVDDDDFGYGVALSADGSTALVGAPMRDEAGLSNSGAAYVFVRGGTIWSQQGKFTHSEQSSRFGSAVALSQVGSTALVGAHLSGVGGVSTAGAAFVFTRSGTSWLFQTTLQASSRKQGDLLGISVAISADGNTVLTGAMWQDEGTLKENGAAYLFYRSGSVWSEQSKLLASDRASSDSFGSSVALSGNGAVALIGADYEGTGATSTNGAAYAFLVASTKSLGSSCTASIECQGGTCVDSVCCNSSCGLGAEDCQACNLPGKLGLCTLISAGTICRTAAGPCDRAETCTGATSTCPMDAMQPAGQICRVASDVCDAAEVCTGVSASCPSDAKKPRGTVCRSAAGICDVEDTCSGSSSICPADSKHPAGFSCRPATSGCDQAEACNGLGDACPADAAKPDATQCGPKSSCQAGNCIVNNPSAQPTSSPPSGTHAVGCNCQAGGQTPPPPALWLFLALLIGRLRFHCRHRR